MSPQRFYYSTIFLAGVFYFNFISGRCLHHRQTTHPAALIFCKHGENNRQSPVSLLSLEYIKLTTSRPPTPPRPPSTAGTQSWSPPARATAYLSIPRLDKYLWNKLYFIFTIYLGIKGHHSLLISSLSIEQNKKPAEVPAKCGQESGASRLTGDVRTVGNVE